MKLPDYPKKGDELDHRWGRQIIDYLRSVTPRSSGRILVNQEPSGTTLNFLEKRASRVTASDSEKYPFQVVVKDAQAREVWVRPATFAGNTPTINGSDLIADLLTAPVLTLSNSGKIIYIQADAGEHHEITSASFNSSNSTAPPETTEETIYRAIASVAIEGGVIKSISPIVGYSLGARWCNGHWDVYSGA